MKSLTNTTNTLSVFLQKLNCAVSKLKNRLQRHYERLYPGLGDLVRIVLDEEEAKSVGSCLFPHLFLPDWWMHTSRGSDWNR